MKDLVTLGMSGFFFCLLVSQASACQSGAMFFQVNKFRLSFHFCSHISVVFSVSGPSLEQSLCSFSPLYAPFIWMYTQFTAQFGTGQDQWKKPASNSCISCLVMFICTFTMLKYIMWKSLHCKALFYRFVLLFFHNFNFHKSRPTEYHYD